ncbi:MAG: hypothetical protein FD126_1179 [Elusimicrobia bacterium]|nr:MAG: hypothetical protein FD126_1179 [Elusimicrobiota bacterium]
MTLRTRALGLALLAALLAPRQALAFEDDFFGLAAGARAVERVVQRGRQGMFTASYLPTRAENARLRLSVLEFRGRGLTPDLLSVSGRTKAWEHLWMSAQLTQPATKGPSASLGLNWETGPVAWSLSAATSRPSSFGLLPGADLAGVWRF